MELDKAFQLAVVLAWKDLTKPAEPLSVRVEYSCEPGRSLDYLSIWSFGAGGRQDLVCEYWTWTSLSHPSGVRFGNTRYSDKLAQTLDFIMKNQGQFTRRADACRYALVQIYPPAADKHTETHRTATKFGGAADQSAAIVQLSVPTILNL
jgi:hypothetical protein